MKPTCKIGNRAKEDSLHLPPMSDRFCFFIIIASNESPTIDRPTMRCNTENGFLPAASTICADRDGHTADGKIRLACQFRPQKFDRCTSSFSACQRFGNHHRFQHVIGLRIGASAKADTDGFSLIRSGQSQLLGNRKLIAGFWFCSYRSTLRSRLC